MELASHATKTKTTQIRVTGFSKMGA